ncbi:hypothetical protein DCMF_08835 [Candidatus Formimonas warabiya]|uniref:Cytosine permease n=2 Tax=Formimonas warabiya TaxID=1761012 RepID=A0A3G1L1I2_FORW1|nr:hypothetical protein DCMF_08835 [Candidatus Formimonas warabiya]
MEDRHIGFWDMTATWMGANCQPSSWYIGGVIAAVGLGGALGITLVANPITYLVLMLIGYMGYKIGTTTMGITRVPFGIQGSRLLSVVNAISLVGWGAVANFIAAISMSYLFNSLFGWPYYGEPGDWWVLAIGAVINGVLSLIFVAIGGSRSLAFVEKVMMVGLLILSTWITIKVLGTYSLAQIAAWRPDESVRMPFGAGVDAMAAFSIGWPICAAEYTRYTKNKISSTLAPFIGANLAIYWFALVGTLGVIAVAIQTGTFDPNYSDPSSVATQLGLGWAALIVVIFATVTTNLINIYSGSVSVANIMPKLDMKKIIWIIGVISILVSLIPLIVGSFLDTFMAFLSNYIGLIFPPVMAILVVDYYLIRKGNYQVDKFDQIGGPYWYSGGFNWYAIASWAISIAVYLFLRKINFGINSTGSLLPGFVLSLIIYWVLAKIGVSSKAYQDVNSLRA